MGIDVSTLEPAERDPAKLRKTAFIIMAIALIGGTIVLWAYRLKTSTEPDRPPIVTRLNSNFGAINQNGKTVDLGQLEGGIWLATMIALSDLETSKETLKVMRELENTFSPEEVTKFVCFTIDPENDVPEKLAEFAEAEGLSSDRWWFLAAGESHIRSYAKDKMLLGVVTEKKTDGVVSLEFPSVLGIFDAHRHLRGRYDFQEAWDVTESARKFMREESPENAEKFYRERGIRPADHIDDYEKLRAHLEKAINYILTEDLKK